MCLLSSHADPSLLLTGSLHCDWVVMLEDDAWATRGVLPQLRELVARIEVEVSVAYGFQHFW